VHSSALSFTSSRVDDESLEFAFRDSINVTIQQIFASGGPAGGQTFEKFDKQVLSAILLHSKSVGHSIVLVSTIMHPLLPGSPNGAARQKGMQPQSFCGLSRRSPCHHTGYDNDCTNGNSVMPIIGA